jgi:type I restriction enzyme R subunit
VNANQAFHKLLRDRVKVDSFDAEGNPTTVELAVIDWANPENNDFFLAEQMRVTGEMYKRRCDLLGFVNGLPLVFIELKAPNVPLKLAYDDNQNDDNQNDDIQKLLEEAELDEAQEKKLEREFAREYRN